MTATLRDPGLEVEAVLHLMVRDYPDRLVHDGKHYALSASPPGHYHQVPAPGCLTIGGPVARSAYQICPVQGLYRDVM